MPQLAGHLQVKPVILRDTQMGPVYGLANVKDQEECPQYPSKAFGLYGGDGGGRAESKQSGAIVPGALLVVRPRTFTGEAAC